MTTVTTRITKLEKSLRAKARSEFIQTVDSSFADSLKCAAANDSAAKLLSEARNDIIRKGQRAAEDKALEQFLAERAPEVSAPASAKFESVVSTEFWHLDANGNVVPFGTEHAYTFDPRTGLVWGKTLPKKLDAKASDEAADKATGLDHLFAEGVKWRQPTRPELLSIVDLSKHNPAINAAAFPETKAEYYRTSSVVSGNSDYRWGVGFGSGTAGSIFGSYSAWVRLVRGPVAALPRQSSAL